MKSSNKYFKNKCLLIFILFFNITVYGQIVNDDCSSATNLGILPLSWDSSCADGSNNWSLGVWDSTISAIPSSPYYYMSGCYGYSGNTTMLADDVWYKFRNTVLGIQLHVLSDDTTHINLYHGTNCTNLQPLGCWTFTNDTNLLGFGTTNDTTNEFNYIQLSGVSPGKKLHYALCLRAWGLSSYPQFGTISTNSTLISENTYNSFFQIGPNPILDFFYVHNIIYGETLKYEIINSIGEQVKTGIVTNEQQITVSNCKNGLYILHLYDSQSNTSKFYKLIIAK